MCSFQDFMLLCTLMQMYSCLDLLQTILRSVTIQSQKKIVVAIGGMFVPVNQAIYPYLSRLYQANIKQFIKFIKKVSLIFLFCSLFLLLISEYFRDEILYLISGSYNTKISIILGIFLLRVITFPFGPLFSNTLIINIPAE